MPRRTSTHVSVLWNALAFSGACASSRPAPTTARPSTSPRRPIRWRGYGYLFGFPDEAVGFFVQAGIEGDATQKVVPRDFVYAVPKGAPESATDRTLREAAAPIYRKYADRRPRFITPDQTGAVALWRAWLAGGLN